MNTDFGGLLGVVYADVVQFGIMITGCTVFLALAVSHHGGWTAILQRVHEIRPTGLAQTPPTPSIDVLTLVVLFLQGWFFAGSPSFLINWGGSFVVNDLMPARFSKADGKIWISRLISLALFLFAAVVTILFVDNMVSWFMFINSAMVIFLLPLSWLRFFWWRFNVWGELSAIVLGLPLSILVWFVLDFQNRPMWQGLGLLFGLSIVVLIGVTLLTPPESKETLKRFYARCRPPGMWGPIRSEVPLEDIGEPTAGRMFVDSMLGIVASLGLVLGTNAIYVGDWKRFGASLLVCIVAGGWLLKRILEGRLAEKPKLEHSMEMAK